ncbi:DHA2 family efflux MFS transporter permease subunit [Brevibacillus borstelensis]|uniref:MDR family MFS transporter n=1 Tax=Brevibacillus borstelensis TaxID=45462 RepID=UPI0030C59F8F
MSVLEKANEKPKVRLITAGLLLGLVLSSVDQTIVSTAMPTILNELGGLSLYSWVFAIYMLASTTAMPLYGKLADLFGRRKMYLIGLFLFLAGSALCGMAGTMEQLIVFRGIQGLGAGALMPIAFTIIGDIYPPDKIGRFQGLFGAVFAVSSILGPAAGGFIAEHVSWNWIFYLNLPIGIPGFLILATALKERKNEERRPIDWLGAITLSGAIVSSLLALVLTGDKPGTEVPYHWGRPEIIGLFSIGMILLGLFVWIETKAKEPIIPLHLFKFRVIAFGNIAGFFVSAGLFSAIAYLPLFVQGVIGVSPSVAGYILTPLMLSTVVTSTIGGRLMSKVSYRAILVPSLAFMAAGYLCLSQMSVDTSILQIVLCMIIVGLGMGAVYPTLGTAAVRAVGFQLRGVATASSQFFRSIGGMIGVSVLGSLMTQRMASGVRQLGEQEAALPVSNLSADQLQSLVNPQLLLDSDARASLPPEALAGLQHVFSDSLGSVFLIGLLFICVALLACVFMGGERLVAPEEK